jgi:hypothetical protein
MDKNHEIIIYYKKKSKPHGKITNAKVTDFF